MSYKEFLIFKVINQERPDLPNEKAEKRTKKTLEFLSLNDAYPISVSNTCVAKVKPSWFFLSLYYSAQRESDSR